MLCACVPEDCPLVPGLTAAQCEVVRAMELPAALPPARGNAKADDVETAWFGFKLFFDARLSGNQEVRCATCHIPERAFDDGRPTSVGLAPVTRNSPSTYLSAWQHWQMWDGRADSLWSQPLLALEDPREMNFSRLELAHLMARSFAQPYEASFGPLPDTLSSWPPAGRPGDAAFDGLAEADRHEVNRIAANVGKALEAYLRKAAHGRGRFDDFLAGDAAQLSAEEQRGLRAFFEAGCDACHRGPRLSDDGFYDVGVQPAEGQAPERGRAAALEMLATSPFSSAGPFFDGEPGSVPAPVAADENAWKTPSLRNVRRTAPYGHNGTHATLESIVELHTPAGALDDEARAALLAFLRALDCADPPSPWNNWPDR